MLPGDGNYTKDQRTLKDVAEQLEQQENTKTRFINSTHGTGTANFLRQLMKKSDQYNKVFFINNYRQALAMDIDRNFKEPGSNKYLDGYDDTKVWNSDRLIVQFDSQWVLLTVSST